jgi:hypothetical protein
MRISLAVCVLVVLILGCAEARADLVAADSGSRRVQALDATTPYGFRLGSLRAGPAHQPGGYEYAPSIIYYQGKYRMYFCALASNNNLYSWDSIKYSESTDGISWSAPVEVLRGANNATSPAVCDPQAVVFQGRIYLYYGDCPGAVNNYDNSCIDSAASGGSTYLTRIGVARSTGSYIDESAWRGPFEKYTNQNRWVTYNPITNTPDGSNGEYPKMILTPDCAANGVNRCQISVPRYGQGQPSGLVDRETLKLWWHDDTAEDATTHVPKLKHATSTDGVNFTVPETQVQPPTPLTVIGGDTYVVRNPFTREYLMTAMSGGHRAEAREVYWTSSNGRDWVGPNPLIRTADMPDYSNNSGLSAGLTGVIIPDRFLIGFNDNTPVTAGTLRIGDLEVYQPPLGVATMPGTYAYEDALAYTAGGWTYSQNMLTRKTGRLRIGLKRFATYRTGEMAGFYIQAPAGQRWVKAEFDWSSNFDANRVYAGVDVPYHHAVWFEKTSGNRSGRAAVWLPEGGFVSFSLYVRSTFTYLGASDASFFEVKNLTFASL